MRTFQTSMYTAEEIQNMIDSLEYMNDADVRETYGFDTVEEARTELTEAYDEAIELEADCKNIYQINGFNGAYEYDSYRF